LKYKTFEKQLTNWNILNQYKAARSTQESTSNIADKDKNARVYRFSDARCEDNTAPWTVAHQSCNGTDRHLTDAKRFRRFYFKSHEKTGTFIASVLHKHYGKEKIARGQRTFRPIHPSYTQSGTVVDAALF